ncbi:hypothetical protein [Dyadobacter sp. NIV53]|uniref:hypothetical protein n=1 Tax=Dyadobacter sp. NIV53 TaxID=2861765 RepID=UPI001C87C9FA|nr:hypothetical protein [Dyadobacter sp. NIV53]
MEFKLLRKIVFKVLLLAIIVFGFIELSYRVITAGCAKNAFTAALVDKHHYANSISTPKIVLVGGSNLAFGINSATLRERTGLPVVNMALLAPLGIHFILSDAAAYVKKGDIVIMSFEYNITVNGDIESQLYVADFTPEDGPFVTDTSGLTGKWKSRLLHRLHAPAKIETVFEKPSVDDPYSIYFRGAFTKEGDIVSQLNNYKGNVHDGNGPISTLPFRKQIESMNAFTKQFEDKGARVFFLYPTVAESFYQNATTAIYDLDKNFDKHLKARILSKPQQSVYADSSCFDTVFHLNGRARDIHTEKVASALLAIGI